MVKREPEADNSTLTVLAEEIRDLRREFRDWREQVYLPGHERVEASVVGDKLNRKSDADALAVGLRNKWQENAEAHKAILVRLDSLNGWRNKVMGVLAVIGFAAPLSVAIWAITGR